MTQLDVLNQNPKEWITIMDYFNGDIWYKETTEEDNLLLKENIEKFFNKYGFNIDECAWMFTSTIPSIHEI